SLLRQPQEELAARPISGTGRTVGTGHAGAMVRRSGGPAVRGRRTDRRPVRIGVLAGAGASLHRQRLGHYAPGCRCRDTRARPVRTKRPPGVGAKRRPREDRNILGLLLSGRELYLETGVLVQTLGEIAIDLRHRNLAVLIARGEVVQGVA